MLKKHFNDLSSEGANLAKIIATFCVVLCHSGAIFTLSDFENADQFRSGIRAFAHAGVPIFFLLSGYFLMCSSKFNWRINIKKKTKSLLVPYIIFMLLYTILNCAGYLIVPSMFDNFHDFRFIGWFKHLIGYPFFSMPEYYTPFWFLRDLLLLNVLSFVLVPIVKKLPSYLLIPAMILFWFTPLPECCRQAFSFFVIGMCFGKENHFPVISSGLLSVILFFVAVAIPYLSENKYLWSLSILLIAFAVISISNYLADFEKIKRIIAFLIPYSFFTYLIHNHPLTLIQKLIVMKTNITFGVAVLLYLFLPFFIIAICIAIANIFKKIAPKVYSVCVGSRYV